jgi:hypothetical protein
MSSSRSMFRAVPLASVFALGAIASASACSVSNEEVSEDDLNYRSTAGQEYSLSAEVTFTLSAESEALTGLQKSAALLSRAEEVRTLAIDSMVTELDRLWPEDLRIKREGTAIQYRQGTAASSEPKPQSKSGTYTLAVSSEFAGVTGFEGKLPLVTEGAQRFLPVPTDVGNGPETMKVTIAPIARSLNAYPKYDELFKDGLDIAVHVGGDHNTPAQDISQAQSIYDDLVASGFKSPVTGFAKLALDSGPLTTSVRIREADVPVRVSLFHADMAASDARQPLVDSYKNSMKNADIVIYNGHAGRRLDYSGVVFAYTPSRVSLPASEFKNVTTGDKNQVYLFDGCETYTGYADRLYENPNRNTKNTDVLTTVNFSALQEKANQVLSFIHAFVDQKSGVWVPRSWDTILTRMNTAGEVSWVHGYGVHGLDDNPKLSPLADASKVGASCTKNADCGAADSLCLAVSGSQKVCGAACADSSACPLGTRCLRPAGKSAEERQCINR